MKTDKIAHKTAYSQFSQETGEPIIVTAEEFVCTSCRHIVTGEAKFCWKCGAEFNTKLSSEIHYKGELITEEELSIHKNALKKVG